MYNNLKCRIRDVQPKYICNVQLGEFPFQGPVECEQPKSVSDSNAWLREVLEPQFRGDILETEDSEP